MAELRPATDADYNAHSRQIKSKIEIFFGATPLVVTQEDMLVDWEIIEELGKDAAETPLGRTSANVLSFSLLGEGGIFNPTNTQSPYYGKIRPGVKIIPYVGTIETEYVPLGIYFVNEWLTTLTSMVVDVTCYDMLDKVFNGLTAHPSVKTNLSIAEAYADFFAGLDIMANVDTALSEELDWWYPQNQNITTLQELGAANMAACYCDHTGTIQVRDMTSPQMLRAIITDQDQLMSANIRTSLNREYDGVNVVLNRHQLSEAQEVLSIKDLPIAPGTTTSPSTQLQGVPVVSINSGSLDSATPNCRIRAYRHTPYEVTYVLENLHLVPATGNLKFFGRTIEVAKSDYSLGGTTPLKVDNAYIQTGEIANKLDRALSRLTESDLAFLDLSIRGNPLLQLGDKITVISTHYGINFTGYILRQQINFSGSFKADIRLVEQTVLEVAG